VKIGISETFAQFSPSTLEMHGFNLFNQILLSYLTFQTHFMITFELFTLFDTFSLQY